jgi:serine protease Do
MDFRKNRWMLRVAAAGTLAVVLSSRATAQTPHRYELADLRALEQAFTDLAVNVRPSVVAIRTYQTRRPSDTDAAVRIPHSQGSGLIIDTSGFIATNAHVIDGGESIVVMLHDRSRFDAVVVQTDERSDLVVLKIDAANLPPVRFGDGSKLRVNQWAFACGNPFGLANHDGKASVTWGVISALNRQMTDRLVGVDPMRYYGNLIETSAAINPGSSGGPLFNLDGEVVGIVAAIETASGVNEGHGFAIPVDKNLLQVMDTLKSGRAVRYGFLDVTVAEVEAPESRRVADSVQPRGARVMQVKPAGPGDRAGLKPGDVIIGFNGTPIEGSDQLIRLVGFTPVGTEAKVTFLRKQVRREVAITVADRRASLDHRPAQE